MVNGYYPLQHGIRVPTQSYEIISSWNHNSRNETKHQLILDVCFRNGPLVELNNHNGCRRIPVKCDALREPVLMRKPQNSVIDLDSLKSKLLWLTICLLMKYSQNKVVKICPFQPKRPKLKMDQIEKLRPFF